MIKWALMAFGGLMAAVILALPLGFLARAVFVIGVGPLLIGVAAGVGAGLVGLLVGLPNRRSTLAAAAVGVLAGWFVLTALDDLHFRNAWREDWVAAGLADSGAGDALATEGDREFYARGADEALEVQVVASVGRDGPLGRWLFRAEQGIRLAGPWRKGRGLPVGIPGALGWAAIELLLGVWVARAVLRRMARAGAAITNPGGVSGPARASEELDEQAGDQEPTA